MAKKAAKAEEIFFDFFFRIEHCASWRAASLGLKYSARCRVVATVCRLVRSVVLGSADENRG